MFSPCATSRIWTESPPSSTNGKPRHAVVIGGGFIGLEMAEAFHHRGLHVTIVERNPHILPLLDRDMADAPAKSNPARRFRLQNQRRSDAVHRRGRGVRRWQPVAGGFDSDERGRESGSGTGEGGGLGDRRNRRSENQWPSGVVRPEYLRRGRRGGDDARPDWAPGRALRWPARPTGRDASPGPTPPARA